MQCVLSSPALPPSRVPCPLSFPHSHKGGLPTFLHQATTLVHTLTALLQSGEQQECVPSSHTVTRARALLSSAPMVECQAVSWPGAHVDRACGHT